MLEMDADGTGAVIGLRTKLFVCMVYMSSVVLPIKATTSRGGLSLGFETYVLTGCVLEVKNL